MLNGLWTAIVNANVSNIDQRPSVYVLNDGKMYGGNSTGYIMGDYSIDGNSISGEFTVTHYSGDPITVFGLVEQGETNCFQHEGRFGGGRIEIKASHADNPKIQLRIELTKRADL